MGYRLSHSKYSLGEMLILDIDVENCTELYVASMPGTTGLINVYRIQLKKVACAAALETTTHYFFFNPPPKLQLQPLQIQESM